METIQQKFGASVRRIRTQRQMSQETLAGAAMLHRTYVSGIERGARNPSLVIISRLARSLDVSLAELFCEVSE